jgi:hypothetical protein
MISLLLSFAFSLDLKSEPYSHTTLTFAIIIRVIPSVSMGSACRNTSNGHSNLLPLDVILRHNWHIDKRSLKYRAAFAHAWQIHIVDR